LSKTFKSLKDKIVQYIQLRLEDLRLEVIERLVNVLGYFIFTILVLLCSLIVLVLTSLGIAEWFSYLMDSRIFGYLLSAGLFLLFTIIIALNSRVIIRLFAGKMLVILTKKSSKKTRHLKEDDED